MPHLGIVASRFGRLDFGLVLLDVLVDGFHGYEQVSQLTLRGALITVREPSECDIFPSRHRQSCVADQGMGGSWGELAQFKPAIFGMGDRLHDLGQIQAELGDISSLFRHGLLQCPPSRL